MTQPAFIIGLSLRTVRPTVRVGQFRTTKRKPSLWYCPHRTTFFMAAVSAVPGVRTVEEQPVRNAIGPNSNILVVGGSRGIGLEFVRQCASRNANIVATCRGEPPAELAKIAKENLHVSVISLEVTDEASAQTAASTLSALYDGVPKLTHIIHNAGVYGQYAELGKVRAEDMVSVFRINAFGVINVVQAFTPLLKAPEGKKKPVIAVLSSRMGSVDDTTSGGHYSYRASKSACNVICKCLSVDLKDKAAFVLLHPGFVRTDLTNGRGLIDVEESVAGMLGAVEATDGGVGFRWVDYKRELIPW